MKLVLCFLSATIVLTAQNPTQDLRESAKKTIQTCISESGVSEEHLTKLRNGERVDCPKLREYSACTFKNLGFMNDNGVIQVDTLRKSLLKEYNAEQAEDVINKCAIHRDDPQLTAYEAILCGYAAKQTKSTS